MAPGDNLTGVLGVAVYLARYERPDLGKALGDALHAVVGSDAISEERGA